MKHLLACKSWIIVGIIMVLLLPAWGWNHSTVSAQEAKIIANSVYVRSGPGTSYDSIGSLTKNTAIDILERRDGWVKISFAGTSGWIAEYLTRPKASTSRLSQQVLINGNLITFETQPISSNGYTMAPLREIFENLGAAVVWESSSQTINVHKSSINISLKVGESAATINGQTINLDEPVQIVNGQTFAPLRFAVEALGGKVIWDEQDQVIRIYAPLNPSDQLTAVSISAADLNIREGPSTSSYIVGMAPNGTILACVAEKDGWFQVKYQGQLAWAAGWLVVPLWNTNVPSRGKEPTLLPVPGNSHDFVRQMLPYAEIASKGTSLPVNFLLAQWAEESGYGTSSLAKFYNNYGGIKDPDTGGFKKYMSADEFAQDVIAVYTKNTKYARLLAHARSGASMQTLVNDLAASGYASSKNYGEKIRTVYLPEINSVLENM